MDRQKAICAVAIALILLGLAFYGLNSLTRRRAQPLPTAVAGPAPTISELQEKEELSEEKEIWVYVSGAVVAPGVYNLFADARVEGAIIAAGGFLPNADKRAINLASVMADGDQIDVPFISEKISEKDAPKGGNLKKKKVNPNRATKEELILLPGIGPKTADSIIELRKKKRLNSLDDLKEISGMGEAKLQHLEPWLIF